MPPKAQAKPGDSKKLKAMEYKHKNPLHKAELARLLKIARGPKYNLTNSTDLLAFVTCTDHWSLAKRRDDPPVILFRRYRPNGDISSRIGQATRLPSTLLRWV